MCGSIKKATSPQEALEYAIAYARDNEQYNEQHQPDAARLADKVLRADVMEFLNNYVPEKHRASAIALAAGKTNDELVTTLNYWDDVID